MTAEPVAGRLEDVRDAALTLFAERGYRATTMADIGEALGLRGPSLYKHVQGKSALLSGVISDATAQLLSDHQAALALGGSPSDRLRRVTEAVVRFHAVHPREAIVGNRELTNLPPSTRAQVIAQRDTIERSFRLLIEQGCIDGSFSDREPRLTTYAILAMGVSVALWFRREGDFSCDEVARHYGRIALRAVGAGSTHTKENKPCVTS